MQTKSLLTEFGFLSTLTGLVTKSSKELSIKQVLFQEFLQLLLIEIMVFGINYLFGFGTAFDAILNVTLTIVIALVFIVVYLVMWLNDQRSAKLFNEKLKAFQEEMIKQ